MPKLITSSRDDYKQMCNEPLFTEEIKQIFSSTEVKFQGEYEYGIIQRRAGRFHTVEDAQTGTGWQKGSKGLPSSVSSIHPFEETALEFNDKSNKKNNTPSHLQNEIEDAMLHTANPKTRASRHSIKIEDALMLDEELDHEGRFPLPVSRSFSAEEAVAFQEALEPQPWQDISQILHTHTISWKESNQNVRPRQSQFAACDNSFALQTCKKQFEDLFVIQHNTYR